MDDPYLVVETPRAGDRNHIVLVSENAGNVSEREIFQLLNAARLQNEGSGFVARKQRVTQQYCGRLGDEILMLAGVDEPTQRALVSSVLEKRLLDVGTLVSDSIDWKTVEEKTVIPSPQLTNWLNQDIRPLLPCRNITPKRSMGKQLGRGPENTAHYLRWVLFGVVLLVLAAGFLSWRWLQLGDAGRPPTHKEEKSQPSLAAKEQKEERRYQSLYKSMLKKSGCGDESKASADLRRAANAKQGETLLKNDKIRDFLGEYGKAIHITERLCFFSFLQEADGHRLRNLLGRSSPTNAKPLAVVQLAEFKKMRHDLRQLGKSYFDLGNWASELKTEARGQPFAEMLQAAVESGGGFKMLDNTWNDSGPDVPFFDQRDFTIAVTLDKFIKKACAQNPLADVDVKKPLLDRFRKIAQMRKDLVLNCDDELRVRRNKRDVRQVPDLENAYNGLKVFFQEISDWEKKNGS